MSRIRSRDTGLETKFLKLLSAELYPYGYRYRKHRKGLQGRPDIVFVKYKVAVFLDGDFWHGYNLRKLGQKVPRKYWLRKIEENIARDKRQTKKLVKEGWRVLRFWEHEIKKNPQKAIKRIRSVINENQN